MSMPKTKAKPTSKSKPAKRKLPVKGCPRSGKVYLPAGQTVVIITFTPKNDDMSEDSRLHRLDD